MTRKKKKNENLSKEELWIIHNINKCLNSVGILNKQIVHLRGCIKSPKKESFLQLNKIGDELTKETFIFQQNIEKTVQLVDEYYNNHKGYIVEDE